jgi:Sec-independent protein secretion pathway component TatC
MMQNIFFTMTKRTNLTYKKKMSSWRHLIFLIHELLFVGWGFQIPIVLVILLNMISNFRELYRLRVGYVTM